MISGNPCTMQIILKHWSDENIKSPSKKLNSHLIEELTIVDTNNKLLRLIGIWNHRYKSNR